MDTVTILYGTESGNSEMVADDVCTALERTGIKSEVFDMETYDVADLGARKLVIVVSSTYGEGDLPQTALPFFDTLNEVRPDLSSTRFAAFGLGDSTYETYNRGIARLVAAFTDLGATQVAETGYHDADSGLDPSEVAADWLTTIFAAATA
ncbi:nitric oxide synthase [Mycobacterium dioxanotrophicus]|uniref:Nitric oxide synthase n=1 Tax=Mycobacterium dioxanotrophicus TaxID=482462 RepID=A0A1Y0CCK3_9MYCO|nr:flavodoxin domain-containing protein [Mycobacterium dioxanotrophicus]ART72993.1 nitric oxide synthase [Mycobacterium dioxanotrophicus]